MRGIVDRLVVSFIRAVACTGSLTRASCVPVYLGKNSYTFGTRGLHLERRELMDKLVDGAL